MVTEQLPPQASPLSDMKRLGLIGTIELGVAFLVGLGLTHLGAGGGAWILGGIVAGALVFSLYRWRYNPQAKPNRTARKLGQLLIGLTVGFSIQHSNLSALSAQLPVLLLLTLFLLASGGAIGYWYSRLQKIDVLTALLATVPGNIGIMASIAADYGKDPTFVSLVQLIRFTAVISIVPLFANVSNSHDVSKIITAFTPDLATLSWTQLLLLGAVLAMTGLAIYLGNKLSIPVAAFICAIAVGLTFNSLVKSLPFSPSEDVHLPTAWTVVGQIFLGTTIGEYWGMNPKLKPSTIGLALLPVGLTFLTGLASAGIAKLLTPWDWLTCLLVTAPGGSPEMIWIALALHRNVEVVTAGHLTRLMTINVLLPVLAALASRLEAPAIEPAETATLKPTSSGSNPT